MFQLDDGLDWACCAPQGESKEVPKSKDEFIVECFSARQHCVIRLCLKAQVFIVVLHGHADRRGESLPSQQDDGVANMAVHTNSEVAVR